MDSQPTTSLALCETTLNDLMSKYKNTEMFYYNLYIESFLDTSLRFQRVQFFKVYNVFRTLGILLHKIKCIVLPLGQRAPCVAAKPQAISQSLWGRELTTEPHVLLGSEEIKLLASFYDVEKFLNSFNIYPLIDSNE
jgi:hypothetical protein